MNRVDEFSPIRSLQEWYGWHFPEMAKILSDNLAYAKVVKAMGRIMPCLRKGRFTDVALLVI
jgi:RNA processing factor Prp31